MIRRTRDPKAQMRAHAARLSIADTVKALEVSDVFGSDDAARTVFREILNEALADRLKTMTVAWMVDALEKAAEFATDPYALSRFRSALIQGIEKRLAEVENAMTTWFRALPEDADCDQEDYAAKVVELARLALRGEL